MRSHSLLHAPGRHLPCARTASSKLKPIICDKVSGNKDSPICRQDGREPQTERQRNQAGCSTQRLLLSGAIRTRGALPGDIRTLEGCRATSGHIMRCRATFRGRSNTSERPNLARERSRCPKTAENPRARMSPELPAASGRRPANAAQLPQRFRYQETAAVSTSKDAHLPHVRAHASTFRIIS